MPSFLDEIIIRNLRLGNSVSDLKVRRYGDQVSVEPGAATVEGTGVAALLDRAGLAARLAAYQGRLAG